MTTYTLTQEQFDRLTLDAQEQVLRNSTRHVPDPEFQRRIQSILREANALLAQPAPGGYPHPRPPALNLSGLTPPAEWYEPSNRSRASRPLDISPGGSPRPPADYATPIVQPPPPPTTRHDPQNFTDRGEIDEVLDLLERRYDRGEANILADVLRRARNIGLHRTVLYEAAEDYYNDLTREAIQG